MYTNQLHFATSALALAEQGWKVFPGRIGEDGNKLSWKSAASSNGQRWGATNNADEIRADFADPSRQLIGAGCVENGIFVVDVDTPAGHGVDGFASLATLPSMPETLTAESPSGSRHYFFRYPDFDVKTSAGEIAPGVDVRGHGGMVFLPPSVRADGAYRWLNSLAIAEAPQWLLEHKALRKAVAPSSGGVAREAPIGHRPAEGTQAARVLAAACEKVAAADVGKANDTLNTQALIVGHYVGSGEIARDVAEYDLSVAAEERGQGRNEAKATIKSGLDAGIKNPALTFSDMVPLAPMLAPAAPAIKSAADLQAKQFSPVCYVVPKYFAEGLTLLAGRPKVGKSWLTLDVGLAVASGGSVLGERVDEGDVLGLFLEDNERRLKTRIQKIMGPFVTWPARFTYATEWSRVDEGGLDQIQAWIKSVPNPRLIIVDVLARVRSQQQGRQAQYEADYQAIAGLQAIASEHRVSVVVVHHLRKSGSESGDAIDKISGTLGLSGAADAILVLDREGSGVTMYARGRDIEEIETAVEFDRSTCRWRVLGQASDVRRSDERKAILGALKETGRPMKRTEIAAAIEKSSNATDQLLWKMLRNGEVTKSERGLYALTPDKNDKIVRTCQPIISAPPY